MGQEAEKGRQEVGANEFFGERDGLVLAARVEEVALEGGECGRVPIEREVGIMDPALLIPGPNERFDADGVKVEDVSEVTADAIVKLVGLEDVPEVNHISDYESDQSDEAMAAADQQV